MFYFVFIQSLSEYHNYSAHVAQFVVSSKILLLVAKGCRLCTEGLSKWSKTPPSGPKIEETAIIDIIFLPVRNSGCY